MYYRFQYMLLSLTLPQYVSVIQSYPVPGMSLSLSIGFHRLCTLTLVHRIQIIGHSYIAQME